MLACNHNHFLKYIRIGGGENLMNIEKVVDRAYYWVDEKAKRTSLLFARKLSRRHFLSRIGVMVAGATAFPLLPVSRLSLVHI